MKYHKMVKKGISFTILPIVEQIVVSLSDLSLTLLRISIIPKKVELLIRFFEPFWILRVFHFFLGTFAEVAGHPEPFEASDETNTQSKIDISGSNETMQNALASIV